MVAGRIGHQPYIQVVDAGIGGEDVLQRGGILCGASKPFPCLRASDPLAVHHPALIIGVGEGGIHLRHKFVLRKFQKIDSSQQEPVALANLSRLEIPVIDKLGAVVAATQGKGNDTTSCLDERAGINDSVSHFYISFLPLHLAILGSGYNTESEVVVDVVDT